MLAAAVVGDFESFPLTLVGGLLIGVGQSLVTRYVSVTGLVDVVPVVLVACVLLARGTRLPGRGENWTRLPSIGGGRARPAVFLALVGAALAVTWTVPLDWLNAFTTEGCYAVILISLVIVVGYCGQLSLMQFAFAGFGAWAAGQLAIVHGWPLIPSLVIGIVATGVLGIVAGFAGLLTRGLNLAIITLGLAVALDSMIFSNTAAQGSIEGMITPPLRFLGIEFTYILYPRRYGTIIVLALALTCVAISRLRRNRVGRRLIAVRANERAAASLGISVAGTKLYAFTLSAVVAAVGGILLAFQETTLTFGNGGYSVFQSVQVLEESVVGGIGWISGGIVGSSLQQGTLGSSFLGLFGNGVATYIFLIGGILLLITILAAPDGVAPNFARQLHGLSSRLGRRRESPTRPEARYASERPVKVLPRRLAIGKLTVHYGGVAAVEGVDLCLEPGRVTGLIGPNGAGKTSIIDAITGFARIASGAVILDGDAVTGWNATRLARAGVGRSFQSLELFSDMTVRENLLVASEPRHRASYLTGLFASRHDELNAPAMAAVREVGLEDHLNRLPSELSFGTQRLVSMARVVAGLPSVLMLDEPTAGLDEGESAELRRLIRRLADDWGMAVLLVEHDVSLIMSVCDDIYALESGRVIGHGSPTEIRSSQLVIDAYLGPAYDLQVDAS